MTRIKVSTKSKRPPTNADRAKLLHYAALEIGRLVLDGEYTLATLGAETEGSAAIPIDMHSTAQSLVAAAKQIAERRAAKLHALRLHLQAKRTKDALTLAAELCGLREDQDETSNRTHSRIN